MKAETNYSEIPQLIAAFAPEFKKEHYHLHGRNIENWESFKSIFLDEHYEVNKLITKMLKGALIGLVNGILVRNFLLRGPKKFELERIYVLGKGSPLLTPLRGYTAFGAVLGATWWLVKDQMFLSHGSDSYTRYLLAHGFMGGIIIASIVHPVNFIYGCIAGTIFGGLKDILNHPNYPKNFELHITATSEQQRRRLLREDEEYELSLRHVLQTGHNLYPL